MLLRRSGVATDGRGVMAGCYRVSETHGMDLGTVFSLLQGNDLYPDVGSTIREMARAGMAPERIHSRLNEAFHDAYGPPPWRLPEVQR